MWECYQRSYQMHFHTFLPRDHKIPYFSPDRCSSIRYKIPYNLQGLHSPGRSLQISQKPSTWSQYTAHRASHMNQSIFLISAQMSLNIHQVCLLCSQKLPSYSAVMEAYK